MSTPECECHGVPMLWTKDERYRAGGFWRCRPKKLARGRCYDQTHRLERDIRDADRSIAVYREKLELLRKDPSVFIR